MDISTDDILNGKSFPYQVDNIFEYILSGQVFKDFNIPLKKELPELNDIIGSYKQMVEGIEPELELSVGEVYGRVIYFISKQFNEYYSCFWKINDVMNYIQTHNPPIYAAPASELWKTVVPEELDWDYIRKIRDSNQPIIAVNFRPIKQLVVIDGNHRLAKKYSRRNSTVHMIVLEQEESLQLMAGDYCKVLYCIHENITTIINYMAGIRNDLKLLDIKRWVK